MEAMNYVKPELIVVAFVLYFFGVALRQAQAVKNKYIPLILGGISMVLCAVWVMATSEIETAKEGAQAVFTAAGDSGGGAEQLCESDYQADP